VSDKNHDDLHGIIPALVTCLTDNHKIDTAGFRRLLKHVLAGGIDGVLVCGTGEEPLLSSSLRADVIRLVRDEVPLEMPLVVGVSGLSTVIVLEAIGNAAKLRANYVLVPPPFYMPIPESEVTEFYREVAGIIDSGGDLTWFQRTILTCKSPQFRIFQGRTTVWYISALLGADGVMDPAINIVPTWDSEIRGLVDLGDLEKARKIQDGLLTLATSYSEPFDYSVYMGVKVALKHLGLVNSTVMKSFKELNTDRRERIKITLEKLSIL
jgi:4-hydroxy-tetrahydrodipicolinate synthase